MKIVWDEPKRISNLAAHALDFADLDEEFFATAIIRPAHSNRYLAFGFSGDRAIAVVFRTLGREAVSVISMRPANRRERSLSDG